MARGVCISMGWNVWGKRFSTLPPPEGWGTCRGSGEGRPLHLCSQAKAPQRDSNTHTTHVFLSVVFRAHCAARKQHTRSVMYMYSTPSATPPQILGLRLQYRLNRTNASAKRVRMRQNASRHRLLGPGVSHLSHLERPSKRPLRSPEKISFLLLLSRTQLSVRR